MCILTKPPLLSHSSLPRVTNKTRMVSAILKHFEEISKVFPPVTFRSNAFCLKTSKISDYQCLQIPRGSKVCACLNTILASSYSDDVGAIEMKK